MSQVLEIMAFSNWIDIFNKITSIKKFQVLYLFHFKCFEQNNKKKIQFRIFNHSVVYRQSKNCIKVQLIYSERPRWTHFLRLNALLYLGFLLLLLQRIYLPNPLCLVTRLAFLMTHEAHTILFKNILRILLLLTCNLLSVNVFCVSIIKVVITSKNYLCINMSICHTT